jgi:glycosyltransferase involved in cell wall biosynthesis
MPFRLAIATPSANAWSETFIAAHIKRLQGVELVLAGGELPTQVVNGKALRHFGGMALLRDALLAKMRGTDQRGLLKKRIAKELRRARIDAVLAEYGTTAHALLEPCAEAGIPLVAHFHGFDAHKESAREATGGYKALFQQAAALVVVSRAMEQRLLALGAPRDKLVYNCYGIDVERFTAGRPAAAPPHFVAIGRFVDKKAPHLTLSAFERLLERVPDARLTIAGQGPLWESCQQRVRSGRLQGKVDLCGIKPPEEVAALLRGARAFVQHSVTALSGDMEGTPLAVLEAMATGIPVVSTRHAGIPDVVQHERHGLLCEEFDADGMAAHMERLALDAALAGRLGAEGRATAEREHRVEDSIERLQAVLDRAAAGAR